MSSSGGNGVEDLAAWGPVAHQVVPGSFPELTTPKRTNESATAVKNTAARICFETARLIGGPLCGLLTEAGGLIRVLGRALLRRVVYRAGGCHQAREGNTHRSTHRHCIVSFSPASPCRSHTNSAAPCQ